MYGAIIGDIAGSIYEGPEHNGQRSYEERMKIMDPDVPLFQKSSTITDDTVLTIAILECLLRGGDYEEYIRLYGNKYRHLGVEECGRSRFGDRFINLLDHKEEGNSFGNGGAMRVSAIPYLFDTYEEVIKETKKATMPTHDHEEGVKGACAVSAAIFFARKGYTKEEIKEKIETEFGYDLNFDLEDLRRNYTFSSKASNSVPQAIFCFLTSDNFEDTIRKAISIGGDTDTIAAISGSISESFYGTPQHLVEEATKYIPDEMLEVLELYHQHKKVTPIEKKISAKNKRTKSPKE